LSFALLALAAPAHAAIVTWTVSGNLALASGVDGVAVGDPFTFSMTFDSSLAPSSTAGGHVTFDGALLNVSFDTPTYHPTIVITPPGLNQIVLPQPGVFVSAACRAAMRRRRIRTCSS
jgi:hypothetical protein